MSSPFESPLAGESKPIRQERLRYVRMYRFLFENPNWLATGGWALLAIASQLIIPLVGNLVLVGYLYEVVETLHRYPGRTYPDFNINRFTEYLSRGCWPFLVSLVVSVPLMFVLVGLYLGGFLAVIVAAENDEPMVQASVAAVVAVVVLLFIALILGFSILALPFMLQAGLAGNLNSEGGLCFRRVKQFIRLTWVDMLLGTLFIQVTSFPIALLGLMCCYFGVFLSAVWITFAGIHLQYQLYEIYLARGGEPIPLPASSQPPIIVNSPFG